MATYTDNYNLIKPSYSEIADVATINTNMNTIDDIMHSTQISLAPAYDSTKTYNIDDVVMYELLMYKCKENGVTGAWNASKWERTAASECGDSGSGGTSVVPNPQGEPTDTLETIEIDGTVYDIAGSGGGGSARKLYKKLYNGNITSTGEVTLLESIENYDFIMIELACLSGEGNPICGSTIADVPYLKSTYNNATSIWVDGGNNDRSAKIAFSNATTMKVNKASAADAIIGVYGFKLEASGGGGTDVYLYNGLIGSSGGSYVTVNLDKPLVPGIYTVIVNDNNTCYSANFHYESGTINITIPIGTLQVTATTAGLTFYSGSFRDIYADILSMYIPI